jgi:hypothetical protein
MEELWASNWFQCLFLDILFFFHSDTSLTNHIVSNQKVVVFTGNCGGIGYETALTLARN